MKKLIRLLPRVIIAVLIFCLLAESGVLAGDYYNAFGFPETTDSIEVIVDQLPGNMSEDQARFAATHYCGSQKLTLDISRRLRQYNPTFLVLHYHLGIWQQNPKHNFIVDGRHWGNDYPFVNRHDSWFWHNADGERVRASSDGKYLMNIANPEFQAYWRKSLEYQMKRGEYQGVFLDSASVALLHPFARQDDPRLGGKAAASVQFEQLGNRTWSQAYEEFMQGLTQYLEKKGYAVIPNIGAQITTWDRTDYYTTASGAFMESAFKTKSEADWKTATERAIKLVSRDKIVIFHTYLGDAFAGRKGRMYYLANYLLLKGRYTYINYMAGSLKWYPELDLDLGAPVRDIERLSDIESDNGLYARKYEKGLAVVNPTNERQVLTLNRSMRRVTPKGGGKVSQSGTVDGTLHYEPVRKVTLKPWSGAVLVH